MAALPAADEERTVLVWCKPRPGSVEDSDYERSDMHDRAIHYRTIGEGVEKMAEYVHGLKWADNIIARIHGTFEEVDVTYLTSSLPSVELLLDLLQGPGKPYPGDEELTLSQKVDNKVQRESSVSRVSTILDRAEHKAQAELVEQRRIDAATAQAQAEECKRQAEEHRRVLKARKRQADQEAEANKRIREKQDADERRCARLAALTGAAEEQKKYMDSHTGVWGFIMLSWLCAFLGQVLPASQLRTRIIGWAALAVTLTMAFLFFFTDLQLVNSPVAIAMVALFLAVIIAGNNLRRDAVLPRSDAAQIEAWYLEMKEIWDALDDRQRDSVPGARDAFKFISDLYCDAKIGPK